MIGENSGEGNRLSTPLLGNPKGGIMLKRFIVLCFGLLLAGCAGSNQLLYSNGAPQRKWYSNEYSQAEIKKILFEFLSPV